MDASDGGKKNGNGHADPSPASLPSAAVPPAGGPVSSSDPSPGAAAAASEQPAEPLVVVDPPAKIPRNEKGQFPKGVSGNPKGNYKRTPNLNTQLIKALRNFKLKDNQGVEHTFLEALIKRALAEPHVLAKLLDKVFVNATPPAEVVKLDIQNNSSSGAAATNSHDTHVNVEKLLSTERGRDTLAQFVERLAACSPDAGELGNARQ